MNSSDTPGLLYHGLMAAELLHLSAHGANDFTALHSNAWPH